MTISSLAIAIVSLNCVVQTPEERADAILAKLGLERTQPLRAHPVTDTYPNKVLGAMYNVASSEFGITLSANSNVPYSISNNKRYTAMREGTYPWSNPLLSKEVLEQKARSITKLLGVPLETDHYEFQYAPDNREPNTVQAANVSYYGFPRYRGVQVAGAVFSIQLDQRSGELVDLHALVDFRFSPPASEISAAEARHRNGIVWNNPGNPPEPKVMWWVPNGMWDAPDWRSELPQVMRKAYLFNAEGANLFVDVQDGKLLGGSTYSNRTSSPKPLAKIPLYTWTKRPKTGR